MLRAYFGWVACVLLAIGMSACGGGSGGGSGVGSNDTGRGLSISPNALSFVAQQNGPLPLSQTVTFTITATDVAYAGADLTSAPAWIFASFLSSTATSAELSVAVNTSALDPGTYTTTFAVGIARRDESIIATRNITVTYTVAGRLTVSPAALHFTQLIGSEPSPTQSLSLSRVGGLSHAWKASVAYQTGSGWLNLKQTSGDTLPGVIEVGVNSALAAGSYSAAIILSGNGSAVSLPVTYTATESVLTFDLNSLSFTLDVNSNNSLTNIRKIVTTGASGVALTWTASASVPWLTVTASGSSSGSATVDLVVAELDGLGAGMHAAAVTFSYVRPTGSVASVTLPITLNLQIPKVNHVAPYVALADTSEPVILRGSGFSRAGGSPIMIGATAVSAYTVVSDTELRVSHPLLTAGTYQIRILNQLGIDRTNAKLVVVNKPSYTYVALPTSLVRNRIIHDLERGAVYTNSWGNYGGPIGSPRVERHRLTSSGWVTDALLLPEVRDLVLTADGAELLVISKTKLYHVDPSALSVTAEFDLATLPYPYNFDDFSKIAMANDGDAIVVLSTQWGRLFRYSVAQRTLTPLPGVTNSFYLASLTASADGSRMIVGQNGISPVQPMYYYDVGLGQAFSTNHNLSVGRVAIDRTGTMSVVDGKVYNRQFVVIGDATAYIPAISPDGRRAYSYVPSTVGGTLRTFDLTKTTVSGGFVEIGTEIPIQDSPGLSVFIQISADGGAVFITGDQRFIVQPVP